MDLEQRLKAVEAQLRVPTSPDPASLVNQLLVPVSRRLEAVEDALKDKGVTAAEVRSIVHSIYKPKELVQSICEGMEGFVDDYLATKKLLGDSIGQTARNAETATAASKAHAEHALYALEAEISKFADGARP